MSAAYDTLRAMPSLSRVSDGGVEWLAAHVEDVRFDPGAELIRQGESDRDCYFIVRGETQVARNDAVLGISGAGEPEGELGLFLASPRTATTTAVTPVVALRLRPDDFDALARDDPDLADDIRIGMCRHLAERFGLPMFAGVSANP